MRPYAGIYETYRANEPPCSRISISPYSHLNSPVGAF